MGEPRLVPGPGDRRSAGRPAGRRRVTAGRRRTRDSAADPDAHLLAVTATPARSPGSQSGTPTVPFWSRLPPGVCRSGTVVSNAAAAPGPIPSPGRRGRAACLTHIQQLRSVTRWPLLRAQARRTDLGLPRPGTRPCPRPGPPAAAWRTDAVPSGRHVSGGYTNRSDPDHDPAGGGAAFPRRLGPAPFHRRTIGRVLQDSDELDETTSRTTQAEDGHVPCPSRGPGDRSTTLLHRGLANQQRQVASSSSEGPCRPRRPETNNGQPTSARRGSFGLTASARGVWVSSTRRRHDDIGDRARSRIVSTVSL